MVERPLLRLGTAVHGMLEGQTSQRVTKRGLIG